MQCSKSVLVAFLVNTWCCADVLPYVTSSPPQEPFDADEYIERLAWRTPGGGSKGGAEAFDPKRYYSILSVICTAHTFLPLNMSGTVHFRLSRAPFHNQNLTSDMKGFCIHWVLIPHVNLTSLPTWQWQAHSSKVLSLVSVAVDVTTSSWPVPQIHLRLILLNFHWSWSDVATDNLLLSGQVMLINQKIPISFYIMCSHSNHYV